MTAKERDLHFECLFKDNYQRLYTYATFMIGDAEHARDLLGDVFERLWKSYLTVEIESAADWLFLCTRNKCIDSIRHQQVRRDYAESIKQQVTDISEWETYDERLDIINKLIKEMPAQTKFAMEQCYLMERTYKEVGGIMGLSESGVKKHIMKGLQIIREYFSVKYKKGQGLKHKSKRIENNDAGQ